MVLISGSLLRQVIFKMFCCQKGFPETPETPLYTPLLVCDLNQSACNAEMKMSSILMTACIRIIIPYSG